MGSSSRRKVPSCHSTKPHPVGPGLWLQAGNVCICRIYTCSFLRAPVFILYLVTCLYTGLFISLELFTSQISWGTQQFTEDLGCWRDGSAVRIACSPCKGPKFDSKPPSGSKPLVTPVLEDQTLLVSKGTLTPICPSPTYTHKTCTHTHTGHTPTPTHPTPTSHTHPHTTEDHFLTPQGLARTQVTYT